MAYQFRNADAPAGGWRLARNQYSFAVDAGAQGAFTLFTVTGTAFVHIFGVCQDSLTGASATIELGIGGNTAALVAQTTGTDLVQYATWQDAVPEANPGVVDITGRSFVITNGADVIMTVATADLEAGIIDFYCLWAPLSADANITAA